MLPTFLIAGAAKSGSTTLWVLLKGHPEVYMAPMKEVNYFISGTWWARHDKGIDWYNHLFEEHKGKKAYGEASINYMSRPESAELIHQVLPNVDLIFMLRDPVDRIYSQYWYQCQEGNKLPDFNTFVHQNHPFLEEWIWGSRYDLHLKRFLELFPTEQIHVFLFNDLKSHPNELVRELYRSVGVDPEYSPRNLQARLNPTRRVQSYWFQRFIVRVERLAYPIQFPPIIQRPFHKVRKALRSVNESEISIPPMDSEIRRELQVNFLETIDFVEKYLSRPLPSWRNRREIEYNFSAQSG